MSRRIPHVCDFCGGFGCKLWRTVVAVATDTMLYCGDCGLKQARLYGIVAISELGSLPDSLGVFCDQIDSQEHGYCLVPAIPADGGRTFHHHLSVPDSGLAWWRALPLRHHAVIDDEIEDSTPS